MGKKTTVLSENWAHQSPKKYKGKTVDLSNKIPLRIDARTTVWVNPDADIEAIKAKYEPYKLMN